ncbi:hypothetical protein GCM10028801_28410 [Nocardioides maradonensis]
MVDFGDLRYDRTVSDDFLAHFVEAGFASALVDYAKAPYPIDFQFRKEVKRPSNQWATLYVGLTAVLNLVDKGTTGLALTAHKTYRDPTLRLGWRDEWSTAATPAEWTTRWADVERYLEKIIAFTVTNGGKYVKTEGIVQAAVSGYLGDHVRAVIDREVMPSFRDTATKTRIHQECSNPLAQALTEADLGFGAPPSSFGMETDALAVDQDGRLIAIEIKPGNVSSLAWVPAQATMYAQVLQRWVDEDKNHWKQIIEKTLEQRRRIGLAAPHFKAKDLQPRVVPAVAFQRVANQTFIDRMHQVQDALVHAGVGDPELEFYSVAPSGRLDAHTHAQD